MIKSFKINAFIFASQFKSFWLLNTKLKKTHFWYRKNVLHHKHRIKNTNDNIHGLGNILSMTISQLLFSLAFAILIQWIDPHIYKYLSGKIEILKIPDDSDYVTFLTSITSVGGVFIGLYYAAISTIGSSFYAKVPNNIRDLLKQERIGSIYMHFLSFFTFLGLSFVSFRIIGFERLYLAIPIMLIGSGIGIIAFVKLGQRAFNLFDPMSLSLNLFEQLKQYVDMVSVLGFQWNDISFQNHSHRNATQCINTIKTLSDISIKEIHLRGLPYINLSKNLLRFLIYYEDKKKMIPSESKWYEQKYNHSDWYRTNDSRVSTAHQTGTSLRPDITNDKEWLEKKLLPIIIDCLEVNLLDGRYNLIFELLDYIDQYLNFITKSGRSDLAFSTLDKISTSIFKIITPSQNDLLVKDEVLEKIGIIEIISTMPINIAISFREYINESKLLDNKNYLSNLNWNKYEEIYSRKFNPYCLPRLEWFQNRLQFEKSIEKNIITPLWYQNELLLQVEAEYFKKNTDQLIYEGANFYKKWRELTNVNKHPWLQGAVISRELEYWHKIEYQLNLWMYQWDIISKEKRIKGLLWAEFEIINLKKSIRERKVNLFTSMSEQHLLLELLKRKDTYPDYAGQFLHTSGEECFNALLNNDIDLLNNVFEKYLYGCVMRFENLRPKSELLDWRLQNEFKIAVAPLLDLMDLSGYARLMADFHNNEEIWGIIIKAWENYFSQKGINSPLPLFIGSIAFTGGGFQIPHRGILRTNWKMKIEEKLTDVPRHHERIRNYGIYSTFIDHLSPLIRLFAREPHGSMHNGIDIFICYYLRSKEQTDKFDFGRKRRDLQLDLDREVKDYQNRKNGEEKSEI